MSLRSLSPLIQSATRPAVLKDFTANLHPDMIGLTGTPEQVQTASRAYKTYFKKQDTGDQYYMMDHSTFTYLMLPGSGFADFFTRDDTAEQIADAGGLLY